MVAVATEIKLNRPQSLVPRPPRGDLVIADKWCQDVISAAASCSAHGDTSSVHNLARHDPGWAETSPPASVSRRGDARLAVGDNLSPGEDRAGSGTSKDAFTSTGPGSSWTGPQLTVHHCLLVMRAGCRR